MLSSELGHVVPVKTGLKQVGIYLPLISTLAAGALSVINTITIFIIIIVINDYPLEKGRFAKALLFP